MADKDLPDVEAIENKSLEQDLTELLNRHSIENRSNTPDFILASFLIECLVAWTRTTRLRERWFRREGPA